MARDLAHHISRIPTKDLPSGFLEEAGLQGSASEILARYSMASLIRRYSALLRVHLTHAEARLSKMDQDAALKRKRLEVRCRCPLLNVFVVVRYPCYGSEFDVLSSHAG